MAESNRSRRSDAFGAGGDDTARHTRPGLARALRCQGARPDADAHARDA